MVELFFDFAGRFFYSFGRGLDRFINRFFGRFIEIFRGAIEPVVRFFADHFFHEAGHAAASQIYEAGNIFYFAADIIDSIGQNLEPHPKFFNNRVGIPEQAHDIIKRPAQKNCDQENTK